MANVIVRKDFLMPKDAGVYHRIMCLTGPDKGVSYFMSSNRIIAGRSESADIVIRDKKASREHFEVVLINGECVLSDLGSHNGVIINELRIKQHKLQDGDKIIIGQTVYKYSKHEVVGEVPVTLDKEHDKDSDFDDEFSDEEGEAAPKKKRPVILMILAIGILAVFLLDDSPAPIGKKSRATRTMTPLPKKKENYDEDVLKKFSASIHRGQREMREKNFFRAIDEFNLALMLKPNDGQASFYLNKAKKQLDDEIESYFIVARRDYESVRYEASLKNYCSVLRLLERYKDDQRYKDALSNGEHIIKYLGYEETGEEYCFKR